MLNTIFKILIGIILIWNLVLEISERFSSNKEDPMTFKLVGNGGNCNGCEWVSAQGRIELNSSDKFRTFMNKYKKLSIPIYINSKGGSFLGSMQLGRAFREFNTDISIGKTITSEDAKFSELTDGKCIDECTIAFLGGANRSVDLHKGKKNRSFILERNILNLTYSNVKEVESVLKIEIPKKKWYNFFRKTPAIEYELLSSYFNDLNLDMNLLKLYKESSQDGVYINGQMLRNYSVIRNITEQIQNSEWTFRKIGSIKMYAAIDSDKISRIAIGCSTEGQLRVYLPYDSAGPAYFPDRRENTTPDKLCSNRSTNLFHDNIDMGIEPMPVLADNDRNDRTSLTFNLAKFQELGETIYEDCWLQGNFWVIPSNYKHHLDEMREIHCKEP